MKRVRKLLLERLGLAGLVTLVQVVVFTSVVVILHYLFFQNNASAMPIVLAGGLISLQPSFLRGRIAVRTVILLFALGCGISGLMTFFFPATPVFYFLSLFIGLVVVVLLKIKPFPASAFIPMNLVYWLHPGTTTGPSFAAGIFLEITVGALLALLVDLCIQMSLRKNLALAYRKYAALLQAREKQYADTEKAPTNNQMLLVLKQIEFLQAGYVKQRDVRGQRAEELAALFESATQLFFTVQVVRDAPAPAAEHLTRLFQEQYTAFQQYLKIWEVPAHENA